MNPCKRNVGVVEMMVGLHSVNAGSNALAERTILGGALPETYAISLTAFRKGKYEVIPPDEADIVLQLWRYRSNVLGDGTIDPLSLALSLWGDTDKRVQMAIDEMLEELQW